MQYSVQENKIIIWLYGKTFLTSVNKSNSVNKSKIPSETTLNEDDKALSSKTVVL